PEPLARRLENRGSDESSPSEASAAMPRRNRIRIASGHSRDRRRKKFRRPERAPFRRRIRRSISRQPRGPGRHRAVERTLQRILHLPFSGERKFAGWVLAEVIPVGLIGRTASAIIFPCRSKNRRSVPSTAF